MHLGILTSDAERKLTVGLEESLQPGLKLRALTQPRTQSLLGPRRAYRAGWEVPSLTPFHGSGASWGAKVAWQREFPGRYRTLCWCPSFGQSVLSSGLCVCSWWGLLSPGRGWIDDVRGGSIKYFLATYSLAFQEVLFRNHWLRIFSPFSHAFCPHHWIFLILIIC